MASTNQDNLSMKYNYGQLDAPHKAIADQVAALLIAYPDVVKLNDPAAQQKFMADVEQSGVGKALAGLGDAGSAIMAKVRGVVPGATTTHQILTAGGEISDGAGKGIDIAMSPLSIPGAGLGAYINEAKVIFNDMTPEKARNIGAHYASVLQVQQETRGADGIMGIIGGFKSTDPEHPYMSAAGNGFSQMWDYIRAGVSWAFDNISSFVTKKPTKSFAEHLSAARFSTDVSAVRQNMATATDLPDAAIYAEALTQGAEVQNRAGTNTTLAAPTAETTTPTLPAAPKDANGNAVVAPTNTLAALGDAKDKAGVALADKAEATFGGINTGWKIAGAVGGTVAAVDAGRGVVHGIKRAPVLAAERESIKLATAAEKAAAQVASIEKDLAPDSVARTLRHSVSAAGEKVGGGVGNRAAGVEAKWEAGLQAKLDVARPHAVEAAEAAEKAKETAEHSRAGLKGAAAKIHVTPSKAEAGFFHRTAYRLAHAPHDMGRWMGDKLWNTVGKGVAQDIQAIKTGISETVENIQKAPEVVKAAPEQFHAGAAQTQAARSAAQLEKTKAALEAAEARLATHAKKAGGDDWLGMFRGAGSRAKEAELVAHEQAIVTKLKGEVRAATTHGVAKGIVHEASKLPAEVAPNFFHRIGGMWGSLKETSASWFGKGGATIVKADEAATTVAKAATVATKTAEAAETTAVAAERIAAGASKVAGHGGGGWIKVGIASIAAIIGGTAAGVAEAHEYDATPEDKRKGNKALNVTGAAVKGGLWDTLGGAIGLPDFAKGDIARGFGSLASLAFIPGADAIDEYRQGQATEKVSASLVGQINQLTPRTGKTGNEYLDRVIKLKAMQARGVQEVAMAPSGLNPLWSTDRMGEVAYEGPAIMSMSPDVPQEITSSVQAAIDLNLRLYVVKGGTLKAAQELTHKAVAEEKAQVAAAPKPAAPAKPALTHKELHAAHDGVIEQARMAVNRVSDEASKLLGGFNLGTAFASITGTTIGGFASHTPAGSTTAQPAQRHVANS